MRGHGPNPGMEQLREPFFFQLADLETGKRLAEQQSFMCFAVSSQDENGAISAKELLVAMRVLGRFWLGPGVA